MSPVSPALWPTQHQEWFAMAPSVLTEEDMRQLLNLPSSLFWTRSQSLCTEPGS